MAKEIVISENEAQKIVMSLIKEPIARSLLIDRCVKTQNLTPEELKNKRPGEKLNKYKCEFGKAISKLINNKYLSQDDNEIISINERKSLQTAHDVEVKIDNDAKIEEIILSALDKKLRSKDEIFQIVKDWCKRNDYKIKDPQSDAGRIMSVLLKEGTVLKTDNLYNLNQKTNEELLHSISPEEFVSHSVKMLKKWYKRVNGYTITDNQITDAPGDGGIDGIIEGVDKMGFAHKIILQMKHKEKNNKNAALADVCAFCGVLASDDATKGLFVTNAKFHQDTIKFAKKYKIKYLMLIDGEKWLELAKQCSYEINKQEND